MDLEKRMLINEATNQFRKELSIDDDQFNIVDLVNSLGGEIEYFDDYYLEESVVKIDKDTFKILINKQNSETRQRFSIAHEIGHLFMHMKFANSEWDNIVIGQKYLRKKGMYSLFEEEANEFAAAFLMPNERFIEIAHKTADEKYFYPQKIARHFNVSEDAVMYRGKNLGLWI